MSKKTIVLAPDSFKGSLSASQVCLSMTQVLNKIYPDINIVSLPMADGGEGTVESLKTSLEVIQKIPVTSVKIKVTSPKKEKKIYAEYIVFEYHGKRTAVIEMASASGLPHLKDNQRNPLYTTTYGTGELIKDAIIKCKCQRVILGIGGSATNDGGAGMIQALGIKFYNKNNNLLIDKMTNSSLSKVNSISANEFHKLTKDIEFSVLCDVNNPLLGKNGATSIFSEQKFSHKMRNNKIKLKKYQDEMEENLKYFYDIAENPKCYKDNSLNISKVRNDNGAGAAGGVGASSKLFLQGKLESGINKIMEITKFQETISKTSLIITGEGRIDNQTTSGKTISGIIQLAKSESIPVIAITGSIKEDTDFSRLKENGLSEIFSICNEKITQEISMKNPIKVFKKRFQEIIESEDKFRELFN